MLMLISCMDGEIEKFSKQIFIYKHTFFLIYTKDILY